MYYLKEWKRWTPLVLKVKPSNLEYLSNHNNKYKIFQENYGSSCSVEIHTYRKRWITIDRDKRRKGITYKWEE